MNHAPKIKTARIPVGPREVAESATDIVVEKVGDTVKSIRITCRCGEVTTIQCSYPEDE